MSRARKTLENSNQLEQIWGRRMKKKTYERPAIVHTEKLEARATVCNKASSDCAPGPIQS